jgi:hypothetical protein
MRGRPLVPVPASGDGGRVMTEAERRAQRRFTWKLLLLGVVTNVVGCGVHYAIWPPRLGGAMARPVLPAVEELKPTGELVPLPPRKP